MRRVPSPVRPDLDRVCADLGFAYAHPDGAPYWDESVRYEFTLTEVERDLEAATVELAALCSELASRAVRDEAMLDRLGVRPSARDAVRASWDAGEPSLYGRFDLAYDGDGPPSLLEFNADTPTSLYEASVFQWHWLERGRADGLLPASADQFNSLHEALVARWPLACPGGRLHLAAMDDVEDQGTIAYLRDCALQAGIDATSMTLRDVGLRGDRFVDLAGTPIDVLFKLYPWEWLLDDPFAASPAMARTRMVEPAWRMALSSKGILPLLWDMAPGHPNLLEARFEDDPRAASLAGSHVRKPLHSREGANVRIVDGHDAIADTAGPYEGPCVLQAYRELPAFDGMRPVVGSWLVGDGAHGIGIREDEGLVTGNRSRFVPHAIVGHLP